MNPLTFFPPPSRSLSRVDSRPSMNSGGGGGSGAPSSGTNSQANSIRSGRRGLQPLTSSNSTSKVPTVSSSSTGARQRTSSGVQTFDGSISSPSSGQASGATTPDREKPSDVQASSKRPGIFSALSSDNGTPRSPTLGGRDRSSSYGGYGSDADANRSRANSGHNSPRRDTKFGTQKKQKQQTNKGHSTPQTNGGGRLGHRLPQGLHFDLVRANETGHAHKLEKESYNIDDAASLEMLRYRQKEAPHLFLGAFLPLPLPKVSGPLSMSGPAPRKLIGYACGTAASALTARSMKYHMDDENAWLVCLHSVCVASEYRHKGLALKLIEEYIRRLRRIEEGHGGKDEQKKGYESVACLAHEETIPLFKKAGFRTLGVSHVNIGSGGWFELRRSIIQQDDEDDGEGGTEGSGGASDKNDTLRSQPSSREGSTSAVEQELIDKDAVITTPTQELERRLQAHADALSAAQMEEPEAGSKGEERATPLQKEDKLQLATVNISGSGESADLQMSPGLISPVLASPIVEQPPAVLSSNGSGATTSATPSTLRDGSVQSPTSSVAAAGGEQPTPFSTSQIMQALRESSSAKSSKSNGYDPKEGPRNPGVAYSTIMGQTLASKTSVEDAFFALEARLVNRDDETNLGDLYCPREDCTGLLLKAGTADWEIAEIGPLMQAHLNMPNSPTPPKAPAPKPPSAALEHVRTAFGAERPASSTTAAQGFWVVRSAMLFENIGFSKDTDWKVPPASSASMSSATSDNTSASHSTTDSGSAQQGTSPPLRKKPTKRGSIFRATSEWIRDKEKGRRQTAMSPSGESKDVGLRSPLQPSSDSDASSVSHLHPSSSSDVAKVKFLLCAECDCGPLGYTVLPRSMEGGAFARDVGKQINGTNAAGADGGPAAVQEQLFFIASDRIRYRLPK